MTDKTIETDNGMALKSTAMLPDLIFMYIRTTITEIMNQAPLLLIDVVVDKLSCSE